MLPRPDWSDLESLKLENAEELFSYAENELELDLTSK